MYGKLFWIGIAVVILTAGSSLAEEARDLELVNESSEITEIEFEDDFLVDEFAEDEEVDEIDLDAIALQYHQGSMPGEASYWLVKKEYVYEGPETCDDTIKVIVSQALAPPWGYLDPEVAPGDEVMIYGAYTEDDSGCSVTLHGSEDYYFETYEYDEIDFDAIALEYCEGNMSGAPSYWIVKLTELYYGAYPCDDVLKVIVYQAIPDEWGYVDSETEVGDEVAVYGAYIENDSGCIVTLQGSEEYFFETMFYDEYEDEFEEEYGEELYQEEENNELQYEGEYDNDETEYEFEGYVEENENEANNNDLE